MKKKMIEKNEEIDVFKSPKLNKRNNGDLYDFRILPPEDDMANSFVSL